ncbi:MAG: hypothetical protein ACRDYA_22310 [Egibacteraceae bacterium]
MRGPAVFGHDPEQILCWKPCCRQPVRLDPTAFELWLPIVLQCDRPRCQRLWTVEFPVTPPGQERVASWRLVACRRE